MTQASRACGMAQRDAPLAKGHRRSSPQLPPCHFGGPRAVVAYDTQELQEVDGWKRPILLGRCAHFVANDRQR
jgi:hypothetical protein